MCAKVIPTRNLAMLLLACSERHSNISFLSQHLLIPVEILPPAFRRSSNGIQNEKTIKKKQQAGTIGGGGMQTNRQAALNPIFAFLFIKTKEKDVQDVIYYDTVGEWGRCQNFSFKKRTVENAARVSSGPNLRQLCTNNIRIQF